ncbi:MAG: ribonuclease R [Bacteroidia bacterium]|nr:ribonuclease R [Bacteroidia bacterium]MCZ2278321.1 ribonuclease R [Bacteroidia bacterium]
MKTYPSSFSGTELKKALTGILNENPHRSLNHKQLNKLLHVSANREAQRFATSEIDKNAKRDLLLSLLNDMVKSGDAIEKDSGRYMAVPEIAYVEGIIDMSGSGAAYLVSDSCDEDIYIAAANLKNALDGDRVRVFLYARKRGQRFTGEVVEILQRSRTEFAGLVQQSQKFAFLIPDSNKMHTDIFIPLKLLHGAVDGDKAVARITEWPTGEKNPVGEIIKVLGKPGENDAEMDSILVEYGFPLEFPEEVKREAEALPVRISAAELKKRKDFRKITTFTIDPEDAKDFDDALSFRILGNGLIEIGVHIADVTHYIRQESALEREASERATSVYLVDRVIPMLPEKLSNEVCSLRPGEDKLCYSAVFEMNENGKVFKEWFGRTVIHSDRRFTYEEAQQVIETGKGDFSNEISVMNHIARQLRKERFRKGAISFDKVEIKFKLDDKGNPVGVYQKAYQDANKLIEEFMLLANRSVASFAGKQKQGSGALHHAAHPFVFRVHEAPPSDKIEDFAGFAARFGYKIRTDSEKEIALSINQLMEQVKGKGEQNVLEQLAVRAMSKAKYTTDNIGHYGLAFDYYSHFTSPIRRYPDMMTHRLLTLYLNKQKFPEKTNLEKLCRHSTEMEIRAAEAERSSIKFKQVQYLAGRNGEVFDGIISGVTEWGVFVELTESKCEGLIRLRDINNDYYEFDEKNFCIRGMHSGREFRLGNPVKVILKKTDLAKKQIDFKLADDKLSVPGRNKIKSPSGKKKKSW